MAAVATIGRDEAEHVAREARRVLAQNRLTGTSAWDGQHYDFVCPSLKRYPFQWFWDSAFHAIALLHVDPELSKQELRCLFQGAQPDGYIAHMLLWEKSKHPEWETAKGSIRFAHPFYTATIQPPVIARAIERIFEATGDVAFVREVFPPTLRFFQWLQRVRDPDGDALVTIIQPDESGLDASPKYDAAMGIPHDPPNATLPALRENMERLFRAYQGVPMAEQVALDVFAFEDVMVNAIYADGWRALAGLAAKLGLPDGAACEREYRRTLAALVEKCWDPTAGAFWDLSGAREEPVRLLTFTSLFPLILPDLDPAIARRLVDEHLRNSAEFQLPYPIPSVAASEPSFDPSLQTDSLWRGGTWINVNWYLYWGLRAHGYADLASDLARRTVALMAKSGVREFYDPITGTGQGAVDFGWSTLVLDLIAAENGGSV